MHLPPNAYFNVLSSLTPVANNQLFNSGIKILIVATNIAPAALVTI